MKTLIINQCIRSRVVIINNREEYYIMKDVKKYIDNFSLLKKDIDAIFGAAWLNTLYDTYKTKEGKAYIIKVFNGYSFLLCFLCYYYGQNMHC